MSHKQISDRSIPLTARAWAVRSAVAK